MATEEAQHVPEKGSLDVGTTYRRAALHDRFGGNRYAGIVPSKREAVVLLFHTEEPSQQFYDDGYDGDGLYWYSGEGTEGDMRWTAANKAVRDHRDNSTELYLFERAQRQEGLWRLAGRMRYVAHKVEKRPDKQGRLRRAIIFALLPARD